MQPPLFILSPPRSFTSITCAMLGNHPQMFGLAETNLFAADTVGKLTLTYRFRPTAEHGLLRSVAELGFLEQTPENVEAVKAWLGDNADMSTYELFQIMGEWADDRSLIEKSPLHVYRSAALNRMREHFPEAYYLHLTRHPSTMWNSVSNLRDKILESKKKIGEFLHMNDESRFRDRELNPEKAWLEPHLAILEFLEDVPLEHQMRLRGEDLLSDPPNYLRQICEWLDKRTDSEAIDAMLHPEDSPFANYGPPNARFGNDPNFMENPQLRPFNNKPAPLDQSDKGGEGEIFSDTLRHCATLLGY
jgi:hypothetical protein